MRACRGSATIEKRKGTVLDFKDAVNKEELMEELMADATAKVTTKADTKAVATATS